MRGAGNRWAPGAQKAGHSLWAATAVAVMSVDTQSQQPTQAHTASLPLPQQTHMHAAPQAAGASGAFQYVIIRPGGLVSEPGTGKAILTEDASASGMIAREDVATLVCKALFSKKAEGKVGAGGGWLAGVEGRKERGRGQ